MKTARLATLALVLAAATGCDREFAPPTLVDKLRILGARAAPPEIRPGRVAALEGLVVDPSRPGRTFSLFWLACDPDPYNLNRGTCTDLSLFEDPSASLDLSTGELPPGLRGVGLDDRAAYAAPAGTFDVLEPEDPRRAEGTVAQVLMLAVGEPVSPLATQEELARVFERVRAKETQAAVGVFRVRVSESAAPNQNPELVEVRYGDDAPPPGAHVLLEAGANVPLQVSVSEASLETYTQQAPQGAEEKVEGMRVSWYSTSGRFTQEKFVLGSELPMEFEAPGPGRPEDVPEGRGGTLWAVLRDPRGGVAWREQPFYVCDPTLPAPRVTALTAPAAPGEALELRGENLEGVVDVLLGGQRVDGSFGVTSGAWTGVPRGLPAGAYALELRTWDCARGDSGLSVTLP